MGKKRTPARPKKRSGHDATMRTFWRKKEVVQCVKEKGLWKKGRERSCVVGER